jgi:Co/Zn/Cd efflux system component
MDCPSCATKIETVAHKVKGVQEVKVSIATQVMMLHTNDTVRLSDVENAIREIGYDLARIEKEADDDLPKSLTHFKPAYRRALWLVILLNAGYGIAEMIGGFIAGSQALKADALDFLGDGSITFFGLLAIGWSLTWRARAALLQGIFLALLGVGVLTNTIYRLIVFETPEPELMGILGFIALAINVAAALILIPHRSGDSNVRAVWLFSRNDAIGNLFVVIAAVFVTWTGTPWPDLIAAGIIAALFLHSSWSIVRDACNDLRIR